MLDDIEITSPCTESWGKMNGDERARHCLKCDLNVYNISEMTRDEAAELIRRTEGRLCARIWRRPDGTVMTRDCPLPARRVPFALKAAAAVLALLIPVVLAMASDEFRRMLGRVYPSPISEWIAPEDEIMGIVCPLPPTPPNSAGR